MKGEDKIFLLEAWCALSSDDKTKYTFMMNKEKTERLVRISTTYPREEFNDEVFKIKEFCDEQI